MQCQSAGAVREPQLDQSKTPKVLKPLSVERQGCQVNCAFFACADAGEWRVVNGAVALDAPPGWPVDLGGALVAHTAGDEIDVDPNDLFRRETDRFVKREINKQPLDVGADRIARTARAALKLLQEVRKATGKAIPLAWYPGIDAGIHAIEVYPGATMAAYGIAAPGYKNRKEGLSARRSLLAFLGEHVRLPEDTGLMVENDDALDAGLCVLAAVDFLRGRAMEPEDLQKALKEGWIWVRSLVE